MIVGKTPWLDPDWMDVKNVLAARSSSGSCFFTQNPAIFFADKSELF